MFRWNIPRGEGERGGNRREYAPRTGVSRVSEAYGPPTVRCRSCRTDRRAATIMGYADSLPEAGERTGKVATDRKDRSGRRSWTFEREPDHGNTRMIRFSVANPSRACSRTNISVRCLKPSEGVRSSRYARLHKAYTNTVDTVSKTRKIYPLYTN